MSKSLNLKLLMKFAWCYILLLLVSTAVACRKPIMITSAPDAYIDKSKKIAVFAYDDSDISPYQNDWISDAIQTKLLNRGFNITENPQNAKYLVRVEYEFGGIMVRLINVASGKLLFKCQRMHSTWYGFGNIDESVCKEIERLVKK